MHSRYSTSDKDANAGRSSVENSGNTKNAWVRRWLLEKWGLTRWEISNAVWTTVGMKASGKPLALQVVMPPLTLLSNSYEKQRCQLAKEGNKSISKSFINSSRKLSFAATVYHVWQERNARIFARLSRTSNLVFNQIECIIRDKLDLMRNVVPTNENKRI